MLSRFFIALSHSSLAIAVRIGDTGNTVFEYERNRFIPAEILDSRD